MISFSWPIHPSSKNVLRYNFMAAVVAELSAIKLWLTHSKLECLKLESILQPALRIEHSVAVLLGRLEIRPIRLGWKFCHRRAKRSSLLCRSVSYKEKKFCNIHTSGLYNKNITIVNDTSRVVRMMPQLGASLMIVILTTLDLLFMLLESSIMLLENIYSEGASHDDCNLRWSYFYSTGHSYLEKMDLKNFLWNIFFFKKFVDNDWHFFNPIVLHCSSICIGGARSFIRMTLSRMTLSMMPQA